MTRSSTGPAARDRTVYAIGIGSNRAFRQLNSPRAVIASALKAIAEPPFTLIASSSTLASRPLGPSARTYANAAAMVETTLSPFDVLDRLQEIESRFHRRRYQRWGARTLDLDLLLWEGGRVQTKRLVIPHYAMQSRSFVLEPLHTIAPRWRDPRTGRTIAQLWALLVKPKPVDPKHRAL